MHIYTFFSSWSIHSLFKNMPLNVWIYYKIIINTFIALKHVHIDLNGRHLCFKLNMDFGTMKMDGEKSRENYAKVQ